MFVDNLDIRMVTPPTLSLNKSVYLITAHSAVPLYSGRVIEYRLIEIYGLKSGPVMDTYPDSYRQVNDMYLKMAFAEIITEEDKYVSDRMLV